MKVKLVSESLQENLEKNLNESLNMISEGAFQDWLKKGVEIFKSLKARYNELNKDDEKAIREFTWDLVATTYVSDNVAAGQKLLKAWCEKYPIEAIKSFIDTASKSNFAGRTIVTREEGKTKVMWKDIKEVKLSGALSGGIRG